jgi:dTDP-4-amino-4,6-dideoxygalactose transaminase
MSTSTFPSWPSFTEEEAQAVAKTLLSNKVNYWTGNEGRLFEQEFAAAMDCEYAVALANGTLALDLALLVLGIGKGDEVIVTPRTFMASASTIVNAGATPIFADVDRESQNITAESIRAVLSERTRGVICVHLAGWPCDMDPIMTLAEEKGFWVIEDCAQSHGTRYKGRSVGSIGHVGAWSFCQDKIMTTGGEGGMFTTNSREIWEKAWSYKDHGKSWDAVYNREHGPGFRWLHESFGTNWRLTELQAAIGRIQLRRLPEWIHRRRENAAVLDACFADVQALRVPHPPEEVFHSYYKYYVFLHPGALAAGWDRDRILLALQKEGIQVFVGSCPEVYLERAFRDAGLGPAERLPVARELGETSLMFLVHPTLEPEHMRRVGEAVRRVMGEAAGAVSLAVPTEG